MTIKELHPSPQTAKQGMRIPVAKPNFTALETNYVMDAWTKGEVSGVPTLEYIRKFEDAWTQRIGRAYCDAVTSGTDALEVTLRALGIGEGDEVLVPAWTFAAPINAVLYVGATPILVDIDSENWTMDPYGVEAHRTPKTRAMIGVDIFGHPCNFSSLSESVVPSEDYLSHKLYPRCHLIEDAAQAHGAMYLGGLGWHYCGNFGVVSTFSMFANKAITSGEGGVILTNQSELAERIHLIRNHGMTGNYDHKLVGGNHRMNNLSAAIGLGQMERWDELIEGRELVAQMYNHYLLPELQRRPVSAWAKPVTWLYCITHPERDRLVAGLREQGIDARPTWKSLDQFPIYRTAVRGEYPIANRVAREAFVLPTYVGLQEETVREIAGILKGLL